MKIPEEAWLGGRTTLPYMHSGEPDNHFLQMATNLNYDNGQPFVLINQIGQEQPWLGVRLLEHPVCVGRRAHGGDSCNTQAALTCSRWTSAARVCRW